MAQWTELCVSGLQVLKAPLRKGKKNQQQTSKKNVFPWCSLKHAKQQTDVWV